MPVAVAAAVFAPAPLKRQRYLRARLTSGLRSTHHADENFAGPCSRLLRVSGTTWSSRGIRRIRAMRVSVAFVVQPRFARQPRVTRPRLPAGAFPFRRSHPSSPERLNFHRPRSRRSSLSPAHVLSSPAPVPSSPRLREPRPPCPQPIRQRQQRHSVRGSTRPLRSRPTATTVAGVVLRGLQSQSVGRSWVWPDSRSGARPSGVGGVAEMSAVAFFDAASTSADAIQRAAYRLWIVWPSSYDELATSIAARCGTAMAATRA